MPNSARERKEKSRQHGTKCRAALRKCENRVEEYAAPREEDGNQIDQNVNNSVNKKKQKQKMPRRADKTFKQSEQKRSARVNKITKQRQQNAERSEQNANQIEQNAEQT